MRESSKYPINGICRFENFPEQNENNDFSKVLVGRMCDVDDWYVTIREKEKYGIIYIYPYLHCPPLPGLRQLSMRCFFSFLNQKPSDNSRKVSRVLVNPNWRPIGNCIKLDELLDEKNGWLSDGTLCIEYGFCAESMEGTNGIWEFNFHDKLFDCNNKQNMIPLEDNRCAPRVPFYVLPRRKPEGSRIQFTKLVPTCPGTTPNHTRSELQNPCYTLKIGGICKFNAMNVRRYCERQLIERQDCFEPLAEYFFIASLHNLNHFLPHLLKYVKSGKQLAIILKHMEIGKMSTEHMKLYTKCFFDISKS